MTEPLRISPVETTVLSPFGQETTSGSNPPANATKMMSEYFAQALSRDPGQVEVEVQSGMEKLLKREAQGAVDRLAAFQPVGHDRHHGGREQLGVRPGYGILPVTGRSVVRSSRQWREEERNEQQRPVQCQKRHLSVLHRVMVLKRTGQTG